MANAFNPQKPQDSALNAVMAGAMGTGKPTGPPVIVATSLKEYANGEDIVGFIPQAFARKTVNGQVSDNGTKFRLKNTATGNSEAGIPSKNDIVGEFTGALALSVKARIVTAGSSISILHLTTGTTSEPIQGAGAWNIGILLFASGAGNPNILVFYRNTSGGSTQLISTSNYPIAETVAMKIERTDTLFVITLSTPTLGTVVGNVDIALVQNGSANLFENVRRAANVSQPDEYEVNEIAGYPDS